MTRRTFARFQALAAVMTLAGALSACGGSGEDFVVRNPDGTIKNPGFGTPGGDNSNAQPGFGSPNIDFLPAEQFAGKCSSPRTGNDPLTNEPWGDVKGTITDENNWLRSMTHDLYLWYSEVKYPNPADYKDPLDYFDQLKTTADLNGAPKDKFHFTYPTDYWQQLSQGGVDVSYGVSFALLKTLPPRKAVVAYVEPAAPTTTLNANITRGLEILAVDGVDLVNDNTEAGVDAINSALYPTSDGETHTFQVKELNGTIRNVMLTSGVVLTKPVLQSKVITTPSGGVGYLLFNDHLGSAEAQLFDAITQLKAAGIQDLVLDIRYNGGGFLDLASELAYMIAGPAKSSGQTFEQVQFNDRHKDKDPVTGAALTPTPFHDKVVFGSNALPVGTALPTLNLSKVYVLTGATTCSASEAIINGLRGVDVEVIQIGSTTCGKPYGFYPLDNCGTTYFTIQFRGVNAKNYGDYTNGFEPAANPSNAAQVKGCMVGDDFTQPLGDSNENLLETALAYRTADACVGLATSMDATSVPPLSSTSAYVLKSEWRMNRILRH